MSFNEEEMEIVTLEFDNGEELECGVLGVFQCEGQDFIALIPADSDEDVFLYGYRETGEEDFELIEIEDDDLFEKVKAAFEEIAAEEDL